MSEIKKFNEHINSFDNSKPFIILTFNVGTSKNPIILKSEPIHDMNHIKRTMKLVQYNNTVLGRTAGKIVEVEKHNFDRWEDLPIDWE